MSIEATYLYTSPQGTPVALKVRTTDKRFFMKAARWLTKANGDPHMVWKGGRGCLERYQPKWADRLLFNLPVVLDALAADKPVVLVEGERDAQTANALWRVAATTSHLGAKKFTPEQADWFTGAWSSRIVIVRDNDSAGAWSAWDRYTRLVTVGVKRSRVQIFRPPDGCKDLTDMALCGLTSSALVRESARVVERLAEAEAARHAAREYTAVRS